MGEIDTKSIESVQAALCYFGEKTELRKPYREPDSDTQQKDLDELQKELANYKVQLEAKGSENLQALLNLQHYQKTIRELSSKLEECEAARDAYMFNSKVQVQKLETEMADQLSEASKLKEQLRQVTELISMRNQVVQDLEHQLLSNSLFIESLQSELQQAIEMSSCSEAVADDLKAKLEDEERRSSKQALYIESLNTNLPIMDTTSNTYSTLYEKLRSSLAEAVDASYQLTNTDVAAHRKALAATKQALLAEIAQLKAPPEYDRGAEDNDDDTSDDEILTKREWNAQMEKLLQKRLKMKVKMEEERAQLSIIGAQCAKQLQWSQGIKSHLIVARDLNILSGERPECWKWTSVPETIYAVAELLRADSIDISCRINSSKLIPSVEYTAYLVFMLKPNGDDVDADEDEKLLASSPYADAYIEAIGKEQRVIKVSLAAKPFLNYEENGDDTNREEADHYAESFEYDGWRGVELGDYTVKEDDEEVEVEIGLKESSGLIKGLIVKGIVIKNRFM